MVEKWLLQVEDVMINSIKKVIGESYTAYQDTVRERWVMEWCGQVVICVSSAFWTMMVERAMDKENGVPVSLVRLKRLAFFAVD